MKTHETTKMQGLKACTFDFKDSNRVDPTYGWVPFVFLIAILPVLLALILLAGYQMI